MQKIPVIFLSLFLLAACGSLLPKGAPAPRLFTLNPPVAAQEPATKLPITLQILIPQAVPGIDSERIALRRNDNQIDYFADTRWTGNVSAMVQSLLVESFDRSNALKAVGNDLVTMNENYSLLVEIRDFQAEYIVHTSTPRAHIRLIAKLIRKDSNEIVSTQIYEEKENADSDEMQAIIAAFDKAFQRASEHMVNDTIGFLRNAK